MIAIIKITEFSSMFKEEGFSFHKVIHVTFIFLSTRKQT